MGRTSKVGRPVQPAARAESRRHHSRFACSSIACWEANAGCIDGIARSLDDGWLRAIALTASSYTTGQSITWVQTRETPASSPGSGPSARAPPAHFEPITLMASSALPFFFPAVEVDGAWCGDGGIRLTAPLSPAVHLGARHIWPFRRYAGTRGSRPSAGRRVSAAGPVARCRNAIFLDQLEDDALQPCSRYVDFRARLPAAHRDGLRRIELLVRRPSQDLGRRRTRMSPSCHGPFAFSRAVSGPRDPVERHADCDVFRPTSQTAHRAGRGRCEGMAPGDSAFLSAALPGKYVRHVFIDGRDAVSCLSVSVRFLQYPDPKFKLVTRP